jgi:hypothetical protein
MMFATFVSSTEPESIPTLPVCSFSQIIPRLRPRKRNVVFRGKGVAASLAAVVPLLVTMVSTGAYRHRSVAHSNQCRDTEDYLPLVAT